MANKSLITYVAPSEKYVKVSNSVVDKLSPEQIGLYAKIVRLSSGKTIDMEFISEKVQMNIRRVRRIIVELEGRGYVVRKQVKGINGRFVGWNYCVYSEPVAKTLRSHAGMGKEGTTELHDFRQVGKPTSQKTDMTENRQDNNIIKDNTIFNNEEIYINEEEKRISNDIPKNTRFVKPTVEQVEAYCKEKNYELDAQYFIDYYDTRGWKLKGGVPVKDWKACVRTWMRNDKKEGNSICCASEQQEGTLPAGLTEKQWKKFQSWGEKNIPRVLPSITPKNFIAMQEMSHNKTDIMAEILKDIEQSGQEGNIERLFDGVRQTENYWERICVGI